MNSETHDLFNKIWLSGQHIGSNKPRIVVKVRRGRYYRRYSHWAGADEDLQGVHVPGTSHWSPWQAFWTPYEDWTELTGINECDLSQTFDQNGITVATLSLDNIREKRVTGFAGIYHMIDRGYLSPWKGYKPPSRPSSGSKTEWYEKLISNAQVKIYLGYGDAIEPAFVGLVDDVDTHSKPDQISLTMRDHGQVFTDQNLFGWVKDKGLDDPITFAQRGSTVVKQNAKSAKKWILVDDPSDIIRIVCVWCGFKEWEIENVGAHLDGKWVFNRQTKMIDIIKKIQDTTGYIFYICPNDPEDATGPDSHPDHDLALGVPIFRENRAIVDSTRHAVIRDTQLLTDIDTKVSDEPLPSIIRIRGKAPPQGTPGDAKSQQAAKVKLAIEKANGAQYLRLGGDKSRRLMATYRPPWASEKRTIHHDDRHAGIIRHQISTDDHLKTQQECEIRARLVALQCALASCTATLETMGNPSLKIDEQIALVDTATGLNTRLYIAQRSVKFTAGQQASFKSTFGGALLDTPDVTDTIADIRSELTLVRGQRPA